MTATTQREEFTAAAGDRLLMAIELGRRQWKVGFTTRLGQRIRRRTLPADAWDRLPEELAAAKQRSYLHGHSGFSRASSRHSGRKPRLRKSDGDLPDTVPLVCSGALSAASRNAQKLPRPRYGRRRRRHRPLYASVSVVRHHSDRPPVIAAAVGVLVVVTTIAGLIPVRRVVRMNPTVAWRQERCRYWPGRQP